MNLFQSGLPLVGVELLVGLVLVAIVESVNTPVAEMPVLLVSEGLLAVVEAFAVLGSVIPAGLRFISTQY